MSLELALNLECVFSNKTLSDYTVKTFYVNTNVNQDKNIHLSRFSYLLLRLFNLITIKFPVLK